MLKHEINFHVLKIGMQIYMMNDLNHDSAVRESLVFVVVGHFSQ